MFDIYDLNKNLFTIAGARTNCRDFMRPATSQPGRIAANLDVSGARKIGGSNCVGLIVEAYLTLRHSPEELPQIILSGGRRSKNMSHDAVWRAKIC